MDGRRMTDDADEGRFWPMTDDADDGRCWRMKMIPDGAVYTTVYPCIPLYTLGTPSIQRSQPAATAAATAAGGPNSPYRHENIRKTDFIASSGEIDRLTSVKGKSSETSLSAIQ